MLNVLDDVEAKESSSSIMRENLIEWFIESFAPFGETSDRDEWDVREIAVDHSPRECLSWDQFE